MLRLAGSLAFVFAGAISCGGGSGAGKDTGAAGGAMTGAGGTAGAGGGTGAGQAGGSGGAIDTHPQTPIGFCVSLDRAGCVLAYQCTSSADRDATFIATYGSSQSECEGMAAGACTTATTDCPALDASQAGACVGATLSLSCLDFLNVNLPASCFLACSSAGGSGGAPGNGGASGPGGQPGVGGASGRGGSSGAGGMLGSGGMSGAGGKSGAGGSSGQLPLCPSDYETASCPVANQSCRIDCASGLCGCTCSSQLRWSCVLL